MLLKGMGVLLSVVVTLQSVSGNLQTTPQVTPHSREVARRQLEQMGIAYNQDNFIASVKDGFISIVTLFLDAGMDPNVKDRGRNEPALAVAVSEGRAKVVQLLLTRGAKVDERDTLGLTPLMRCPYNCDTSILSTLIDAGADVNARTWFEETPLMEYVIHFRRVDCLDVLIKAGADVNARDRDCDTPLIHAAFMGHTEALLRLLSRGADVNAQNSDGYSALMVAIEQQEAESVRLLLKYSPKLNLRNNRGKTALMIARTKGRPDIARLLRKAGATK